MEDTITEPQAADDAGAEQAVPAEQTDTSAASTPAEPTTTDGEDNASESADDSDKDSLPDVDPKLKAWAESKGVPLDSDGAVKAAKIAMDNQAEFQRTRQEASKLEKTLKQDMQAAADDGDTDQVTALAAQVEQLTMTQNVSNFLTNGSDEEIADKKAHEPKMAQIVTDNPDIGVMVKRGFLTLDHLYAMAKGSDSSRDEKLKTDGGREALQKVANKQKAKAVVGAATTSDLATDDKKDPFLEGFNREASSS